MSKFEELFDKIKNGRLDEDGAPIGVGMNTTSTVPNGSAPFTSGSTGTTPTTTPTTPSSSAPVPTTTTYDTNHPIIQQLSKTTNPDDVLKLLQSAKIALPQQT